MRRKRDEGSILGLTATSRICSAGRRSRRVALSGDLAAIFDDDRAPLLGVTPRMAGS